MIKNKKSFALLIALFFCVSLLIPNVAFGQATDIKDHWAEKQITSWINQDLVRGYEDGSFKPNNKITRVEFITMVNRSFGFIEKADSTYKDVETGAWYAEGVARASKIGYVTGYEDGTMKPNSPISRQEAASIISKIFELNTSDLSVASKFTDASDIPSWSKGFVSAIVAEGYMGGYPDKTFRAKNLITRAESVTMLGKAVGQLYNMAGTYGSSNEKTIIDGNVTINTADIILKNIEIKGNLYITEGVGQGKVILEEVVVQGNTINKSSRNLMSKTADKYGITHQNYPIIDGSTSTFSIVSEINRAMYQDANNDNYPKEPSKTVPSYKLLINGDVDMIIVPYPSSDVLTLAEDAGVNLEFFEIAAEALIFITPIENQTENISKEQLRKIYLDYGIKNWSELDGPDRELVPICRNPDSGSQSQMDNLILNDKEMHPAIQENYVELTMESMLEQVAFYHGGGLDGEPTESYALGYTLYTYLQNVGEITGIDEKLKILSFEGVAPSGKSIADGSYSLGDGYYAVIRNDLPQENNARNIIKWLKSDEGQDIIESLGFISKK